MTRQKRMFSARVAQGLGCVLVLASTALVSACTPGQDALATINYQEVSACTANGGNDPNAPDTQIILVFEITSITNEGSNAVPFTFNPKLLYIRGDNGDDYAATSQAGSSGLSLAGAPFGFARTQTVAAGSALTVNAGVVVTDTATPNSSSIADANTTNFTLLYATPAGSEGVLLVKTNNDAARYPTVNTWGCPHYL